MLDSEGKIANLCHISDHHYHLAVMSKVIASSIQQDEWMISPIRT